MATDRTQELAQIGPMSMAVRIYGRARASARTPLVLHLHGGAFVDGSLDAGECISNLLAEAGAVVVSPDYPLAPKHKFPQPLQAAFGLLSFLDGNRARFAGKKSPLIVAGEEAGGNLAAALALMARDQQTPTLAGQILISPMLDPAMATCSIRAAEAGPVGCKWADGWHQYLGTADKASHPYAAPLGSSRLNGLPPALILTAEDDPMRDESLAYARRLHESGVAVDDHLLSAPTGWPDALQQADTTAAAWRDVVRDHIKNFLARVEKPVRASSLSLEHA